MTPCERSRDASQLPEFFSQDFRATLLRRARFLERDVERAADLVQETMLRALRHTGLDPGEGARRWFYVVLRNTFLSRKRRERVDAGARDRLEHEGRVSLAPAAPESEPFHEALGALGVEFREVLALVELDGCSYAEAAEILKIPVGTVMSRLYRAKKRLRHALADPVSEAP